MIAICQQQWDHIIHCSESPVLCGRWEQASPSEISEISVVDEETEAFK